MAHKSKAAPLEWGNLVPHPGQRATLRSFFKFLVTVLAPGRQWGKSTLRRFWIHEVARRTPGWATLAYMGPAHSDAKKAFDEDYMTFGPRGANIIIPSESGGDDQDRHIGYMPFVPDCPVDENGVRHDDGLTATQFCECDECVDWRDAVRALGGRQNEGCRVYYVSGGPDAHGQFQKHKLDGAFLDERSHMANGALWDTIFPMFNTTGGHLLDVGTPIPDGINFSGFADEFAMGVPGTGLHDPDWNCISGRSEDNPFADLAFIAKQRALYAKMGRGTLARCLFDGEFAVDSGAVFQNLEAVFSLDFHEEDGVKISRPSVAGERVAVGVDLGAGGDGDPTVVSAVSIDTLEQLALARIDEPNYFRQIPLVDAVIKRFKGARVWCEGRESGAMFKDYMLRQYGEFCQIVKWASGGEWDKNAQVNRGIDLCQQAGVDGMRGWRLIRDPVQRAEFKDFAKTRTPSGLVKYGAPSGKHDDHVAASLYAAYGCPVAVRDAAPVAEKPPEQFSVAWMRMIQGERVSIGSSPSRMPL